MPTLHYSTIRLCKKVFILPKKSPHVIKILSFALFSLYLSPESIRREWSLPEQTRRDIGHWKSFSISPSSHFELCIRRKSHQVARFPVFGARIGIEKARKVVLLLPAPNLLFACEEKNLHWKAISRSRDAGRAAFYPPFPNRSGVNFISYFSFPLSLSPWHPSDDDQKLDLILSRPDFFLL